MRRWRHRHLTASPPSPNPPPQGGRERRERSGRRERGVLPERNRAGAQYRRLRADGRRAREGVGAREVHRRSRRTGPAGGTHLPQPLFARRDPRRRRLRGAAAAGREGDRHRRRLRQDLRRAADRAQRASAGARQGALPRRAGRGGRGRRRRHRQARAPPDQAEGARAARLLHGEGGDGATAPARSTTRSPNNLERDVLFELGNVEQGFARPTSCARPPTTAPRSARTRWRCTPRSPTTTPCATA